MTDLTDALSAAMEKCAILTAKIDKMPNVGNAEKEDLRRAVDEADELILKVKVELKAKRETRDKKLREIIEEFKKKERPAKEAYDKVVKPLREIRDKKLKATREEFKKG